MVVRNHIIDVPTGAIDRADEDDQLESAVVTALADPAQPRLVYQPILDLGSGDVRGFETLSRFCSPLSATPDRWFAAARRLGVGARLEADVLRQGIARLPELPDGVFLTVNLDPRLVIEPEVQELLTGSGQLDGLVIELSERAVASDLRRMIACLDEARAAGAMVAMDDTGAGYSSLERLLTVRPGIVKLDRALVTGLDRDVIRRSLIAMIVEFVDRIGAQVLAQGLEAPEELRACRELGVPLGQGWLLGRPHDHWMTAAPPVVRAAIHGPAEHAAAG